MDTPSPGVSGYFDDYKQRAVPPNTQTVVVEKREDANDSLKKKVEVNQEQVPVAKERPVSRVGRPPGTKNGSRSHKRKTTLHIDGALLDYYSDWTWEARCNLGELVERAMVAYKKANPRNETK